MHPDLYAIMMGKRKPIRRVDYYVDVSGSMRIHPDKLNEIFRREIDVQNDFNIKKEKDMSRTASVLERMADKNLSDELATYGVSELPAGIREALEEAQAEEAKNASKAAALEILNLIKAHDAQAERHVKEIRRLRAMVEQQLEMLADLNKAKAYGLEKNNFVPLAVKLGKIYTHDLDNRSLAEIPKDYKPAAKDTKKSK